MKTTRQQILDLISTNEITTVKDISRVLHITPANARHHLGILTQEGLVEVAGVRRHPGAGRPHQLFQLTHRRLEHNLDKLSHYLLQWIVLDKDKCFIDSMLSAIASRLLQSAVDSKIEDEKLSLNQRMQKAVQQLNQLHYRSRWEAHTSGPRLILGHCPFSAIIHEHPELCQLDQHILEIMIKEPVVQKSKLERSPQGSAFCAFQVNLSQNKDYRHGETGF